MEIAVIVVPIIFALNLVGLALYHGTYSKDYPTFPWKLNNDFWWMTFWLFFFGVAYIPTWISNQIKLRKNGK